MVDHSPHNPKVKGLSPTTVVITWEGGNNNNKYFNFYIHSNLKVKRVFLCYFLMPGSIGSGWIQTLDLVMMRIVFYQCATMLAINLNCTQDNIKCITFGRVLFKLSFFLQVTVVRQKDFNKRILKMAPRHSA
jgi:hypothetical protein